MNQVLYGFRNLQDRKNELINDKNVGVVSEAIRETVRVHNEDLRALLALFAERTTRIKEVYKQPVSARLQPLDEYGRARPIKTYGKYEIAYPIAGGGIADGLTYVAQAKQTIGDVESTLATITLADINWMRDHLQAALYNNTPMTFNDEEYGDLVVQPLANADGVQYLKRGGGNASTSQHYLAQAAAISDAANPYAGLGRLLRSYPQNGNQVVVLVPTNLIEDTENLATFADRPDPNIDKGANEDVLRGAPGVDVPGELRGYDKAGRCWIYEWADAADDRIIGVAPQAPKALKQREYEQEKLQGFTQVGERNDFPYFERQFARWTDFGSFNRVAAAVYEIGNAAYSLPAGFERPMP